MRRVALASEVGSALVLAIALVALPSAPASADGRIVLFGDEWYFSDTAFTTEPVNVPALALNTAGFLAGGSGSILAYSDNFSLTGSSLAGTMTGAGYGWTVSTAPPFTLATLQSYDAIYLGGSFGSGATNAAVLVQYVQGGGNVFLCGGTGAFGSAAGEASAWQPFLSAFGLQLGDSFFAPQAMVTIPLLSSANPVAAGVTAIIWGFGQTASETAPSNPDTDSVFGDFAAYALGTAPVIATYAVACGAPCGADLDANGTVDGGDLGILLGDWGSAGGPADLNCDGIVDGADLGALLGAWGPCP